MSDLGTQEAAKATWWGRATTRRRGLLIAGAALIIAAVIAITVALTAKPSLEAVAEECGGRIAGLHVDDTGLLVDVSNGTDALICVMPKILSDKAHHYTVAMALDSGETRTLQLEGRAVSIGNLGGSPFVFFTD